MTKEQKDLILAFEKVLDNLWDKKEQLMHEKGIKGWAKPTGFVWYENALKDVKKALMDIEKSL